MTEAIQQHYVPQMILRRFAGEDGMLDVVERHSGKSWRRSPGRIACERYYNAARTNEGELDTQTIERWLSDVEGRAEPVLSKLLEGSDLSPEERSSFALFLTIQDFRSPRQRQAFADLVLAIEHHGLSAIDPRSIEHYRDMILRASSNPRPFDSDRPRVDNRLTVEKDGTITIAREDTVRAIKAAIAFAPVVANMEWVLFRAPERKRFILSDSPVQLYEHPSTLPEHTGPAYWRQNSHVSFPLTASVSFVGAHMPSTSNVFTWRPRIRWRTATAQDWNFLNDLQIGSCYRQVYATHATEGLIRRCKSLSSRETNLSFMPVADNGNPLSARVRRR